MSVSGDVRYSQRPRPEVAAAVVMMKQFSLHPMRYIRWMVWGYETFECSSVLYMKA